MQIHIFDLTLNRDAPSEFWTISIGKLQKKIFCKLEFDGSKKIPVHQNWLKSILSATNDVLDTPIADILYFVEQYTFTKNFKNINIEWKT